MIRGAQSNGTSWVEDKWDTIEMEFICGPDDIFEIEDFVVWVILVAKGISKGGCLIHATRVAGEELDLALVIRE